MVLPSLKEIFLFFRNFENFVLLISGVECQVYHICFQAFVKSFGVGYHHMDVVFVVVIYL